jgi:dolichyl-phosphate-mannose-protein mannosyltransferase
MSTKTKHLTILFIISFLTHFLFLTYPQEVVFDEVHFGKFVTYYFTRNFYFDIHPPLGKLIIAFFAYLLGYQPKSEIKFDHIGEPLPKEVLFTLRFAPALFGVLFIILIYKLILLFGFSERTAFFGGLIFAFENGILIQSKFIFLDIFLIFFGFLALYFFFSSQKERGLKSFLLFLLSSIFATFAFSIKWTGLTFFLLIVGSFYVISIFKTPFWKFFLKLAIFLSVSFLVYFLIFWIHFSLLNYSGPGDPFMSQRFQKSLMGNKIEKEVKPLSILGKFIELNWVMLKHNLHFEASHPYSSKWYQWPFMIKPIWYWSKKIDNKMGNIYFLGNFTIWILVLFAIFKSSMLIFKKSCPKDILWPVVFTLIGYFTNLISFIFVTRICFLYHYLPALCFGMLNFIFLSEKTLKSKTKIFLLILIIINFFLFSPVTYGFLIPQK